jgi:hypothetical protein
MTDLTIRYDYDDGRPSKVVTVQTPENAGSLLHDSAWYDGLINAFDDGAEWTTQDGASNSSDRFEELVAAVRDLIMGGGAGHCLSSHWAGATARLIMAHLAHVHHMVPLPVDIEYVDRDTE